MTFQSRWSILATFIAAMALIVIAAFYSSPTPTGRTSFVGWTNIKGQVHASIAFEPVTDSRPHKNWFMFQFYRVGLKFRYTDKEGRSNTQWLHENVYFYPHQTGVFQFPVPTNAIMIEFHGAETWLERRWDNLDLGFRLPSRHFSFTSPVIGSEQMEELRRFRNRNNPIP